ncbi:MAG: hypothetical protein QGF09_15740, partial [Rhodospirillales bacterium]|nr:hypothetical protein [Rhodospirillales bacterium]
MNCNMKMLIVAVAAVGLTSAAFTSFGHHRMASGKSYTHGHGGGYQRGHFRGRAAHGFRRGPGARRGRGMRVERLFTNFDSDKDGKLTQAEV